MLRIYWSVSFFGNKKGAELSLNAIKVLVYPHTNK